MPAEEYTRLRNIQARIQIVCAQDPHALRRLFRANIVDLGDGTLVKYGTRVHPGEGYALRIVRESTATTLLPKVFDIVTDDAKNETYIIQQKLPGTLLSEMLFTNNPTATTTTTTTIDEPTLLSIASELRTFLAELSKLDGDGKVWGWWEETAALIMVSSHAMTCGHIVGEDVWKESQLPSDSFVG